MAILEINPRHRAQFAQLGLVSPEQVLALPCEVISGHPDRNVGEVSLGTPPNALACYLKREHRVSWKDRLLNMAAGFGLVSKSCREAQMLRRLEETGIAVPEWLAAGEDGLGRAFLLVRATKGGLDLRQFLRMASHEWPGGRKHFFRHLGEQLARLHEAGFSHSDLYAKHVLVDAAQQELLFLDWQRARAWQLVPPWRRWYDLATLHATIANEIASRRERVTCLLSYLRATGVPRRGRIHLARELLATIATAANRLLQQRRIREQRQAVHSPLKQSVIWQDGEALCLTPELEAVLKGQLPDWLRLSNLPLAPRLLRLTTKVSLSPAQTALLIRHREGCWLTGLWQWLWRRPLSTNLVRQAGQLFRLQRQGLPGPRVLAFGQRRARFGKVESFLLTTVEGRSE
jgi:tRNA A-37 threonylcarbamoyl transferase component Bud32